MSNELLNVALGYERRGFSVIPIRPDKKPYVKWEPYQKRRATPEEIKDWWAQWPRAMIGVVTGSISGVSHVDIDTSEGYHEIQAYIPDSVVMPSYVTPSGGQQMIFETPDPPLPNNTRVVPGCDFRGEAGFSVVPPSSNGKGKYEWVPGLSLAEVPPPPLPAAYISFIKSFAVKGGIGGCRQSVDSRPLNFDLGGRDETFFHIALCLARGGMRKAEAVQVLESLTKVCDQTPPIPDPQEKAASAFKRIERKNRVLSEDVFEWVLSTTGYFSSTDIYGCLQLSTREDKKNVSIILKRLADKCVIQRHPERNACFRRIETECEGIDWLNAPSETVDLKWPLGIERYVRILPRNIICIAGEPDAGKTAFLLNFVKLNMDFHDVHFFSSEMGPIELKDRLKHFDIPPEKWRFHAKERGSNFADVIAPDAINCIDFLEIHDEFYKVGGHIKEIHDRLKDGIAIIALQKNRGTPYGLGGMRGMEKARLYLSMEPGKIRIIKAKNWKDPRCNPHNLELDFNLAKGCMFVARNDWHKNEDGP